MTNVLECYLIILKNNEELLNRRIEDLNIKENNLNQKEFLLSKLKDNKKDWSADLNKSKSENFAVIINEKFSLECILY